MKRRKGRWDFITIMSQNSDGGIEGLNNCVMGGLQCGYFFVLFYLMWLLSFRTKKFLVVVRIYRRVLSQTKRQEGLSTECQFQTPSLLLIDSMSTL